MGCGTLPEWLKIRHTENINSSKIARLMRSLSLHSVCQSAHCPNRHECWAAGTASFMVLGDYCTRACRFCAIKTLARPPPPDIDEPKNLAQAVESLGLGYVVITSVTRDDLEYGGAGHIAECIHMVRKKNPETVIEALVPDFLADKTAINKVIEARPDVVSHNIETVERLTPRVRDLRARYRRSLEVLRLFSELSEGRIITKSGLMLGFGESESDVKQAMGDLRASRVEILTIGQYLSPGKTARYLPVKEFVRPEKFLEYEKLGYGLGFRYVASGPFVRSSYKAAEPFVLGLLRYKCTKDD